MTSTLQIKNLEADMARMSLADNTYKQQHMDDVYVTGNIVRVAAINLPAFIDETDSSPENQLPVSSPACL